MTRDVSPAKEQKSSDSQFFGWTGQRAPNPGPVQIPKEVIDYDSALPLIAEPGSDRRHNTPEPILEALNQAWARACSAEFQQSVGGSKRARLNFPKAGEFGLDDARAREANSGNAADLSPSEWDEKIEDETRPVDLHRYLDFTPAARAKEPSLSGPSFLGLNSNGAALEEDEPTGGTRWTWYAAAFALATVSVLAWPHRVFIRSTGLHYLGLGSAYVQHYLQYLKRPGSSSVGTARPEIAGEDKAGNRPAMIAEPPRTTAQSNAPLGRTQATAPEMPSAPPSQNQSATAVQPGPSITAESAPQPSTPIDDQKSTDDLKSQVASDAAGEQSPAPPPQLASSQAATVAREPQRDVETTKRQVPKPPEYQRAVPGQAEYQQALTAPNPDVSRALLWRATSLGNSDAQVRLAEMYIYGQGVAQNCDQGLVLLRSAAQKANAPARGKLGALYATGRCVPQSRVEAYRWFSLALDSDPANQWVATNRQIIWQHMSADERATAAAR